MACSADANRVRNKIFILSHDNAKKCGWVKPDTIKKSRCGIKSDCITWFLLPFSEHKNYLKDHEM